MHKLIQDESSSMLAVLLITKMQIFITLAHVTNASSSLCLLNDLGYIPKCKVKGCR